MNANFEYYGGAFPAELLHYLLAVHDYMPGKPCRALRNYAYAIRKKPTLCEKTGKMKQGFTYSHWIEFCDLLLYDRHLTSFNIGGVLCYPREAHAYKYPQKDFCMSEFIVDIDLDEKKDPYPRWCDCESTYCEECWGFVNNTVQVVDRVLEYRFGFKYRMWSTSGSKGVHCWVFGAKSRILNKDMMSAINLYLKHYVDCYDEFSMHLKQISIDNFHKDVAHFNNLKLKMMTDEQIIDFMRPRIDASVVRNTGVKKLPGCIHHKNGQISLPLPRNMIGNYKIVDVANNKNHSEAITDVIEYIQSVADLFETEYHVVEENNTPKLNLNNGVPIEEYVKENELDICKMFLLQAAVIEAE